MVRCAPKQIGLICICSLETSFLIGKDANKTDEAIYHPTTSSIYITTAALCLLLSTVTQFKYNSVKVLNVTVRSKVISNIPWITYFIVLFMRSVVGAVIYAITPPNDSSHYKSQLTAYFMADGFLKSLEVLCLLWALNHQRIYRSGGFMQQEVNSLNSEDLSSSSQHGGFSAATRTLKNSKTEAVFMAQFIFAILFMILLEELKEVNKDKPGLFYWIYMFFFWSQCISTVVLAVLIAAKRNEDGPTFVVKLLVIAGVVFTLPGDIPSFIWSTCLSCSCSPKYFLTAYDIALFLSIPSIIIFFVVLRTEFLRLDQETQYRVIGGEVDSLFSVHSETIAEN
ncbi:uncharacterized protein [Porites lutea]|uniref:uncharacterized protein n=1 Tax=Porites lutea TaxID=51062 RepID=UPI003CC54EDE